jgi:PiT family inorganic phosphate transporter
MEVLLIAVAVAVAFFNGANDNIKGFAAAWGAGQIEYRRAVAMAATATLLGCVLSTLTGRALLSTFSGRGLVSAEALALPGFLAAAAAGASLTLFLATRLGLPVSTTHALLGGLVGAGVAAEGALRPGPLATIFLAPLILTPVLSLGLSFVANRFGARVPSGSRTISLVSAFFICAARATNDTPKIVALLAGTSVGGLAGASLVASAMVLGGLVLSDRVGQTMGRGLVTLEPRLGTTSNFVAASIVLAASVLGSPVSTTHVTVGAIAGAGAQARAVHSGVLRDVALSWVGTLPLAALLSLLAMRGGMAIS